MPPPRILCRQAAAGTTRDARVAELVRLVRAAARGETLPGYVVDADPSRRRAIETWRGTRFVAHVLAIGPDAHAAALAERFGPGVAAVWATSRNARATHERIAVVVRELGRSGALR